MANMLMGKAPGEMNLASLRARADDLRRTLDQLIQLLQFAPERLTWAETLDRFTVVNVQYQQLEEQLRPMLRHWVVHPKSVNQANAATLPIMLATKLLPEMEAEQEELLSKLAGEPAAAPAPAGMGASAPLPVALEQGLVRQQCEAWNASLAALESTLKAGQQRQLAAAPRASMPAHGAPAVPGAVRVPGAVQAVPGAARRREEELQGAELLLAAASYGAGL